MFTNIFVGQIEDQQVYTIMSVKVPVV